MDKTTKNIKNTLLNHIKNTDFNNFSKDWHKTQFTEVEKQTFLALIFHERYYDNNKFSFYKKIFELIISNNLNLNFELEHWSPTFLALVYQKAPHIPLFDYFISKGATINYIANPLFDEDTLSYQTCLDFAELRMADLLSVDYNFYVPDKHLYDKNWTDIEKEETVTIDKQTYHYLLQQAIYLENLIKSDELLNHMQHLGFKTFDELYKKDKTIIKKLELVERNYIDVT